MRNEQEIKDILNSLDLTQVGRGDYELLISMKQFLHNKGFLSRKQMLLLDHKFDKMEWLISRTDVTKHEPEQPVAKLNGKTIHLYNGTFEMCKEAGAERRSDYWSLPLRINYVDKLKNIGFAFDDSLQNWLDTNTQTTESTEVEDPFLDGVLRPYQKIGVNFIRERDGKVLLADDMGLGKTLQVLSYLQLEPSTLPAVVVCPASVKRKWESEVLKWTDLQPFVIDGRWDESAQTIDADIVILNYDIMHVSVGKNLVVRPDVASVCQTLVFDECHALKNRNTKRTKAAKNLAKTVKRVLGITGTPVENRPMDAWNIMEMINRYAIPDFWTFVHTFCDAKKNRWGWDFTGASNTDQFHELLTSTFMLRRKKVDVLTDLPPKIRSVEPIEWDKSHYIEQYEKFMGWVSNIREMNKAKGMVEIEALKYAAVQAKMKGAIEWLEDALEEMDKVIIFTRRVDTITKLKEELKKYNPVILDGSVSSTDRQTAIDTFQNDNKCRVFIGNMKASGTGIDLTAANAVVFMELGWTSTEHDQCEDRAHRIGQVGSVNVYYLIAQGTIEDKIVEMLDHKREIVSSIMDNEEVEDFDMLSELLKQMKKGE
jgi:SWI/SNF-related matrix-associated actin-dependent regulator of chromatin subfamily A-like protein 1